jgi:hypothetical protein
MSVFPPAINLPANLRIYEDTILSSLSTRDDIYPQPDGILRPNVEYQSLLGEDKLGITKAFDNGEKMRL